MAEQIEVFVSLDSAADPLPEIAARALGRPVQRMGAVRLLRRSLDARKGRPLGYRLRLEVGRPGESLGAEEAPAPRPSWPAGRPVPRVVIVGAGPAGAWAALRLAEAGVPSTVLERGKPVQPRRRDLANLQRGQLDPSSNYCFGEGGAGTYSDGKLYTRSKDRAGVAEVLADLVRFGAPADIAVDSRPHVGSNLLPKVLTALRLHLEALGCTYRFETEAAGLRRDGDGGRVRAVTLAGGDEVPADVVVLAVGHSSRSTYEWLARGGIAVERKDFALGVRLEHPQELVDRLQYGRSPRDERLPAAFYEMKGGAPDRPAYSFCMCPGGWIVPAATEADGVVVNGMSLSRRDSPFANSGLVVPVRAADMGPAAAGPLAGVELQRAIERRAFVAGGGKFRAPAQRLGDFLAGRPSTSAPKCSYRPGLTPGAIDDLFPALVTAALRDGLAAMTKKVPGFLHPDAVLVGVETRTSAPVRIVRDPERLQSPSVEGLFPVGEGAGYAGGIVSAALDGARVAAWVLAEANS